MVSPLLVKASPPGREIVNITPERAGWTHTGFRALRLAQGEHFNTGERELCLVVRAGHADVGVDGQTFPRLDNRSSVFDNAPVGSASAPLRAVRLIELASMKRSVRGTESNTRYVCDILPHDDPTAAHLPVVEVRTPASHS